MDDADDGGGDGDGDGKDLRLSFLYVQTPDQPGAWRGTSYVILPPWPISPVLFLPRAAPRGSGKCTLDGQKLAKQNTGNRTRRTRKGGRRAPRNLALDRPTSV